MMFKGHPQSQDPTKESDHTRVIRERMDEIQVEIAANAAKIKQLQADADAQAQQPTQVIVIRGLK